MGTSEKQLKLWFPRQQQRKPWPPCPTLAPSSALCQHSCSWDCAINQVRELILLKNNHFCFLNSLSLASVSSTSFLCCHTATRAHSVTSRNKCPQVQEWGHNAAEIGL